VHRKEEDENSVEVKVTTQLLADTVRLCEFVFVRRLTEFCWAYLRKEKGWCALIPLGFSPLVLFISLLL
jgi:hypothetical protein